MRIKTFTILAIILLFISINSKSLASEDAIDSNTTQGDELMAVAKTNSTSYEDVDNYISGEAFNAAFGPLFKEFVSQDGRVDYAKLRRMRIELNDHMSRLENLQPNVYISWAKEDKIAFWINSYNICTMKGIINNYPIKPSRFMLLFYPANSIMHIKGLRTNTFFNIMGLQYNLNEIEKDILLGKFSKAEATFAISYGTVSSPPLRNEPYIGKLLQEQLENQIRKCFADPTFFDIDSSNTSLQLTPIFKMYDWRTNAFIKLYANEKLYRQYSEQERGILNFLKNYISDNNANILKKKVYEFQYSKYNWALNDWLK